MDEYDLPISIAAMLLNGVVEKRSHIDIINSFREGNFKVTDEGFAKDIADKIHDLKPFMAPGVWRNRELIYALSIVESKVDHKELVSKISQSGWTINRQASTKNYLRMLEDMYNYKKQARERLF